MKTGDLRKQIIIQQEQQTSDGAGGYALAWINVATVWADIAPASGGEVFAAGHLEGHVTHKITMRWRSDLNVTTDMRAIYSMRLFNIRAVINQGEANQFVTLLVEEGAAI